MQSTLKPIRLSAHAKEQLHFRGGAESEVNEAIRSRPWRSAELGRHQCDLTLPFDSEWNGRHYATKTIRPIFVEEKEALVVVTVYVYYKAREEPSR